MLNAPNVLTFAFVKIGFATKCAMCGDGGGELADVWGRGLLAVESVVWALRAGESAVVVALVRASSQTENRSHKCFNPVRQLNIPRFAGFRGMATQCPNFSCGF